MSMERCADTIFHSGFNCVKLEIQRTGRGRLCRSTCKDVRNHVNADFNIGENLFPWPSGVRNKVVQDRKHTLRIHWPWLEYQELELYSYADSLAMTTL